MLTTGELETTLLDIEINIEEKRIRNNFNSSAKLYHNFVEFIILLNLNCNFNLKRVCATFSSGRWWIACFRGGR